MVAGTDGNVWFAINGHTGGAPGGIGHITPSGSVVDFPTYFPAGGLGFTNAVLSTVWGLAVGPDGSIWFSAYREADLGLIGRVPP